MTGPPNIDLDLRAESILIARNDSTLRGPNANLKVAGPVMSATVVKGMSR